jgi:hypothetical protein
MSIKINKQLQRPDKGTLSAGSIIDNTTRFIPESKTIIYYLTHWFNELAKETAKEDGWLPVANVKNFPYKIIKNCTIEEWSKIEEASASTIVENWLKELIDSKIGIGFTEII